MPWQAPFQMAEARFEMSLHVANTPDTPRAMKLTSMELLFNNGKIDVSNQQP